MAESTNFARRGRRRASPSGISRRTRFSHPRYAAFYKTPSKLPGLQRNFQLAGSDNPVLPVSEKVSGSGRR